MPPASWRAARAQFVIIENNEAKAQKFASENWLMLIGDATQEQTLRDAQIDRARGLVAATTTDATNLYIVLTARSLNPSLRIIARASEEMAEKHLRSAGADAVVCPYVFAGQRIAHSFLRPHVVSFLDTATTHLGMDLEIGEVPITPRSPFAGKTIENSRIRQDRGVIILAIKREAGMRFNPAPDDRIEAGDFLIAMGEPQQLRELEQTAGSDAIMKIVSAAEMRDIDRATSERFGVPSLTLMENAGSAVARFILSDYPQAERVGVVCGKGNNGGDGFVVARKLVEAGRAVRVLLLCDPEELRGDAAAMFQNMWVLSAANIAPLIVREASGLDSADAVEIFAADVIVDAILGTGFRPPVSPLYAAAIGKMNAASAPIVAVDIPSGADADAMQPQTGAVSATKPAPMPS